MKIYAFLFIALAQPALAGQALVSLPCPVSTQAQVSAKLQGASVLVNWTCDSAPVPTPTGTCPAIPNTTGGTFTRWTGTQAANFTSGPTPRQVDVTSFASVFQFAGKPWPGSTGIVPMLPVPTNRYVSLQFTVPADAPPTLLGSLLVGDTGYSAPLSMTVSGSCGDFSAPTTAGSTVVPGCYKNRIQARGGFSWHITGPGCVLRPGGTYFLNYANFDAANVTPHGGSAATTANAQCVRACSDPILNSWSK